MTNQFASTEWLLIAIWNTYMGDHKKHASIAYHHRNDQLIVVSFPVVLSNHRKNCVLTLNVIHFSISFFVNVIKYKFGFHTITNQTFFLLLS